MKIVGELINASREPIRKAIEAQDADYIKKVARDQQDAGADYIDVNAGVFVAEESEYLKWLVTIVQEAADIPCSIDSPNPKAIEAALPLHTKGIPLVNSISLETERYDYLLPILSGSDYPVIALCISNKGMPEGVEEIMANADELITGLTGAGVPVDHIYVDPLVKPISVNDSYGMEALESIDRIMKEYPGVHTVWGNSNLSFGVPKRWILNQVLAVAAITRGLDAAILNPLDKRLMAFITAAETLAGKDECCMTYMKAYRKKKFEV
ncbi:MAG: dihydropteroate synthase [Dehalococcoidia bacterium]